MTNTQRNHPEETRSAVRRRCALILAAILLLAAAWRIALAAAMPCLSRDGALSCWFARELGQQPVRDVLQHGQWAQHPLYATAVLAVQRTARLVGAPDAPLTWQRSGQAVSCIAGLLVVLLTATLTRQIVQRLALLLNADWTACIAALLAALLPQNTWLSTDVMTDQLHAALYLGAAVLLVRMDCWQAALGCGLLAGFAFLARPEGGVLAAAGLMVIVAAPSVGPQAKLARALLLALGFLLCATPYWAVSGKLSPKLDKEPIEHFRPAVSDDAAFAALVRKDMEWYGLAPEVALQVARAGRVVVPLAAIPALWLLRRRLLRPPLLGLTLSGSAHLMLLLTLLRRSGYLDQRHALVFVLLLIPFAAISLRRLFEAAGPARRWAWPAVAACVLPLAVYSARIPNFDDAFLHRMAEWTAAHEGARPTGEQPALLLGGSAERRVAFYADLRFQPWPENTEPFEKRVEAARDHLLHFSPEYFALRIGEGDELRDSVKLRDALQSDPAIRERLELLHVEKSRAEQVLLYRFQREPPTGASQPAALPRGGDPP